MYKRVVISLRYVLSIILLATSTFHMHGASLGQHDRNISRGDICALLNPLTNRDIERVATLPSKRFVYVPKEIRTLLIESSQTELSFASAILRAELRNDAHVAGYDTVVAGVARAVAYFSQQSSVLAQLEAYGNQLVAGALNIVVEFSQYQERQIAKVSCPTLSFVALYDVVGHFIIATYPCCCNSAPAITSGSYVGKVKAGANITSAKPIGDWYYTQTGTTVEVWAYVSLKLSSANTATNFRISLPAELPARGDVMGMWIGQRTNQSWRLHGMVQQSANQHYVICSSTEGAAQIANNFGEAMIHLRYTVDVDNARMMAMDDAMKATRTAVDLSLNNRVTVDNAIASAGESVQYIVDVFNNDAVDASGVTVSDIMPSELAVTSVLMDTGSYDTGTGVWTIGFLGSGQSAQLVINAVVVDYVQQSKDVINTATITAPTLVNPSAGTSSVTFPLQHSCLFTDHSFLELSRVGTEGILGADNIKWQQIATDFFITCNLIVEPGINVSFVLQYVTDPDPGINLIASFDNAMAPVSLDWIRINDITYVAVGNVDNDTMLQLYRFDPTSEVPLVLAQTISGATTVSVLRWVTLEGVGYLAVALDSNQLALYRLESSYADPQLNWLQTVTLDADIASVRALAWQVEDAVAYVAVGCAGVDSDNDNPLLQLYSLSNTAPLLTMIHEIRSSVAGEAVNALGWHVIEGQPYLASGEHQPIASGSKPEIVRVYQFNSGYTAQELSEVARLDTAELNGMVQSLQWHGSLIAVGGNFGARLYADEFDQTSCLCLCRFSTNDGFQLSKIDEVPLLIVNGSVQDIAWHPDATVCQMAVAGQLFDNGTSGSSDLRFYYLCYQADLVVTNTVDNNNPAVNDTITYTITVTNMGSHEVYSAYVIDQLPAGVTFSSATPGLGSYDNASGVWTIGTLASGATVTLSLSATVDSGSTGLEITNTALAIGQCVVDPYGHNQASAVINVQ